MRQGFIIFVVVSCGKAIITWSFLHSSNILHGSTSQRINLLCRLNRNEAASCFPTKRHFFGSGTVLRTRRPFFSAAGQASTQQEDLQLLLNQHLNAEEAHNDVSQQLPLTEQRQVLLVGGDFCGLSASFSASTGQRLPIPDHWIPPSLLEWGQVPSSLEVIVSEELLPAHRRAGDVDSTDGNEEHDDDVSATLQRHTLTVLPETGCAVDNLETIATHLSTALTSWRSWQIEPNDSNDPQAVKSVVALTYSSSSSTDKVGGANDNNSNKLQNHQVLHMEASFGVQENDNTVSGSSSDYRIRVQFSVDVHINLDIDLQNQRDQQQNALDVHLRTPIHINLERQFNTTSSHGTLADGGGLDGRTISRLLGPTIVRKQKQVFAEPQPLHFMWSSSPSNDVVDDPSLASQVVALPANVTIAIVRNNVGFAEQPRVEPIFMVDVAYHHFHRNDYHLSDEGDDDLRESVSRSQRIRKVVVRFPLSTTNDGRGFVIKAPRLLDQTSL